MIKLKFKDEVVALSGKDKGKKGAIERVLPTSNQVVVTGLSMAKRHTKPSSKFPRGGIRDITRPMPAGKVALVCPNCHQPTRIGYVVKGKNKERICRKCKAVLK